jgi:hypothetical protein
MTRPKTHEICGLNCNAPGMMRNANNAGNHLLQGCNNSYRHQSNLSNWNVFTSSNCNAFVSQNDSTGASVHLKRFHRDPALVGELNPNHSSSPHWDMSRGGVSSGQNSQKEYLGFFLRTCPSLLSIKAMICLTVPGSSIRPRCMTICIG